jgi:hypothetical protein
MPRVIAIRANNGKFVCAENGGASPLVANRDVIGPWEQFLMVEHGPGKVALQACNGKYVRPAGATNELLTHRDVITNDEVFDLNSQGGSNVAFRHSGGRFVSAEGERVLVNRGAVGPAETFALVSVQGRSTAFNPEVHGFHFVNTFEVEPVNDVRFSGLCGGMVYAALDYFNARIPVPTQTFRPAVNTPLANYIYARQCKSAFDNVDKWGELFFNPFGWRTNEFFNWGLQGFNGGRLQELRTQIDAGRPAPLGLFKAGNGGTGPHHQVLALGYALGRYQGDLGQLSEDLRIFIYDPNHPGLVMTLAPSVGNHAYYYVENPAETWMTYFVDRKYRPTQPPLIASPPPSSEGMVNEILLELRTGGDDLRGGNDNVHATINFRDGSSETAPNINGLARWINNYTQTVPIALRRAVPVADLKSVVLTTTFGGGPFGDNWNLDALRVIAAGRELYNRRGAPLCRFTGENRPFVAELAA